jgi:hypothetical protein
MTPELHHLREIRNGCATWPPRTKDPGPVAGDNSIGLSVRPETRNLRYIRALRSQALRYNYIYLSVLSHLATSMKEHERILAALQKRDGASVERLVRAHGDAAGKALCAYIEHPAGDKQIHDSHGS